MSSYFPRNLTVLEVCDDCEQIESTSVWVENGENYYLCDECHPQRTYNNTNRFQGELRAWEVKIA